MKRMIEIKRNKIAGAAGLFLMLGGAFFVAACSDTIDESNYAIADKETVYGYIEDHPNFSCIKKIFDDVKLIDDEAGLSSTIANTLQTRGNYTCFLPVDTAVLSYAESLTGYREVDSLSYSQKQHIALSCIIDNGETAAYESPDFPTNETAFLLPNLDDRTLTCMEVSEVQDDEDPYFLINGEAKVLQSDIEVSNGYVHTVDHVISPSTDAVPDLIASANNLQIFSMLLQRTGWDEKTNGNGVTSDYNFDQDYENEEHAEEEALNGVYDHFKVPQRRYLGYTILAETDDVLADWAGVSISEYNGGTIPSEVLDDIYNKIVEKVEPQYNVDGQGTAVANVSTNPTDVASAINRFVAYHIMKGKINNFVRHFNEYGYAYGDITNPQSVTYTVDVWDYYITMGGPLKTDNGSDPKGIVKVLQRPTDGHPIYVNRVAEYRTDANYEQKSVKNEGIKLNMSNGSYKNSGQNGYYYTLDGVLLYDNSTRNYLSQERLRVDLTTLLPEMISNTLRGTNYYYLPTGYFDNITNESSDTRIFYLQCGRGNSAHNWLDWQGDEFIFAGLFDFIIQLPPVPVDGNYEIRMGVSQNPQRGMAQIYIGDNVNNLQPAGLPYDARQGLSDNPSIPWVEDVEDEEINQENDKNMRNLGYMKGAKYMIRNDGGGWNSDTFREASGVGGGGHVRRIITSDYYMYAGKTYYLRYKSALEKRDAQWFMDYFEVVNKTVYNGAEAEDIW